MLALSSQESLIVPSYSLEPSNTADPLSPPKKKMATFSEETLREDAEDKESPGGGGEKVGEEAHKEKHGPLLHSATFNAKGKRSGGDGQVRSRGKPKKKVE